ncbi:hypothetical protein C8R44DRAFT_724682 [Mycena epipterygia]|nr:hypothetical protein C8R44DRAFT_724682 [Mycena epipterygia]
MQNCSFMHPVLHADYQLHKAYILRAQLDFLITHPPDELFVVAFDYTSSTMHVAIRPTSELDTQWEYHIARAAQSEGRIEMYMVTMSEDEPEDPPRLFPLQSTNGVLQAGLRGRPGTGRRWTWTARSKRWWYRFTEPQLLRNSNVNGERLP